MAIIPTSGEFTKVPEGGGGGGFDYATFSGGGQVGGPARCDITFDEISKMKTPIGYYDGAFFKLHYSIDERTGVALYSASNFIVYVSGTNVTVATNVSIDSNNSVVIATQIRHFAS